MPPKQLKETSMDPNTRTLIKVLLPKKNIFEGDDRSAVENLVNILMGKNWVDLTQGGGWIIPSCPQDFIT